MSKSKLQRAYRGLPVASQRLVQILALCDTKVRLATVIELLKLCGWADAPTKSGVITQALLKPQLQEAADRGLVDCASASMTSVSTARSSQDFAVQQAVLEGNFPRIVEAIQHRHNRLVSDSREYSASGHTLGAARRELRIAFYSGDVAGFEQARQRLDRAQVSLSEIGLLDPFNPSLYEQTPAELQQQILISGVSHSILTATGSAELTEALDEFVQRGEALSPELAETWVSTLVASGDLAGLEAHAASDLPGHIAAEGCHAFLIGEHAAAAAAFERLVKQLRQNSGKRNVVLPPLPGLLHLLLLLRDGDPQASRVLKSFCAAAQTQWPVELQVIAEIIQAAATYTDSPTTSAKTALRITMARRLRNAVPLAKALVVHLQKWLRFEATTAWQGTLCEGSAAYAELGMSWLAALCEDAALECANDAAQRSIQGQCHQQLGTYPMLLWIEPPAPWRRALETLRRIANHTPASSESSLVDSGFDERMIWELDASIGRQGWSAQLRPFIQKRSAGGWTKGRPVSLERLYHQHTERAFAFLTAQDREVIQCIKVSEVSTGYYRYTETVYEFQLEAALRALVGHPLIFSSGNRTEPLELTTRQPQLVIQRQKSGVRLQLDPKPQGSSVVLVKEGPRRLAVVAFSPQQSRLAEILDEVLEVPKEGEAELLETAKSLSTLVPVQSDVALGDAAGDANLAVVDAQAQPHLHLLPFHAGVRAEFFVRPFGEEGPFFSPGHGGEIVFADLQGQTVSTRRDLKRETELAHEVVAACPSLAAVAGGRLDAFEFASADEALEMLLEIEPLREQGKLALHWPQGQSLRVAGSADASQLRVRIRRDQNWFAASGELVVDERLQLDMLQLMELVSASPSRFVPLSDGRFLALTEQLQRRVAEFAAFGERKQDSLRFPPIRAAALSDLDQWCTLQADKHWKATLQRIAEAGEVVAEVPSTLDAELRDYQVEGFRWMCRLAHWGAGACLADDMGLGKTLQAIALLLHRGAEGPALVVAPTSVCFNWENELHRFAPTLRPRFFGGPDREELLADLGPRDVVIASYGLLHSEAERLQAVSWHTAVLDEAQAIKNTLTKRSRAAMALQADFRLILTGTPIENHLGELWNLFQFINPGLLGSSEQFQQRFALPIERDQNREVRQQLKRLVQPFLLRRTKTQVLSELPPRIEVTVPVTLSEDEALLYEAARQRAVQELSGPTDDPAGQRLRILAQIMRLRRACCHPSLLLPECDLEGAKLAAFSQTLDELLENNHKALVFSQFVDHLAILRAELERKGVSYQYLDGSTPIKQRQRRVEAFQNGEGDVFLISLKAGGTGLNLTAADYVLHMDPWWNPAVEDQAADRAHRLGQRRPVTIYRFITRGTIEEKILELHATKRDLADSLLEGTDTSGRLSTEELLALLK